MDVGCRIGCSSLGHICCSTPVTGKVAPTKKMNLLFWSLAAIFTVRDTFSRRSLHHHQSHYTNSKYRKCIITIIIVTATKTIHRYFNWKEDFSSLNSWRLPGKGAWSRKPVANTDCEGKHLRWNISLIEECYLSGD